MCKTATYLLLISLPPLWCFLFCPCSSSPCRTPNDGGVTNDIEVRNFTVEQTTPVATFLLKEGKEREMWQVEREVALRPRHVPVRESKTTWKLRSCRCQPGVPRQRPWCACAPASLATPGKQSEGMTKHLRNACPKRVFLDLCVSSFSALPKIYPMVFGILNWAAIISWRVTCRISLFDQKVRVEVFSGVLTPSLGVVLRGGRGVRGPPPGFFFI